MRFLKIVSFCFIAAFIINPVFSQKIEKGTYKSFLGYKIDPITHEESYYFEYGEKISFINDSLFEYNYHDDITNDIGQGIYEISSNVLTLRFTTKIITDSSRIKILDSKQSSYDSVTIKFIVKDREYNTRLWGVIIKCKNYLLGCETNKDGIGILKLAKNIIPCDIWVTYVGYKSIEFRLNDPLDKTIEIGMASPYHVIPPGKILQYRMKDIDENSFYLFGGIWTEWTFFKKMD